MIWEGLNKGRKRNVTICKEEGGGAGTGGRGSKKQLLWNEQM